MQRTIEEMLLDNGCTITTKRTQTVYQVFDVEESLAVAPRSNSCKRQELNDPQNPSSNVGQRKNAFQMMKAPQANVDRIKHYLLSVTPMNSSKNGFAIFLKEMVRCCILQDKTCCIQPGCLDFGKLKRMLCSATDDQGIECLRGLFQNKSAAIKGASRFIMKQLNFGRCKKMRIFGTQQLISFTANPQYAQNNKEFNGKRGQLRKILHAIREAACRFEHRYDNFPRIAPGVAGKVDMMVIPDEVDSGVQNEDEDIPVQPQEMIDAEDAQTQPQNCTQSFTEEGQTQTEENIQISWNIVSDLESSHSFNTDDSKHSGFVSETPQPCC